MLPLKIRAGSFAAGGLTAGYGVIRDTCQYSKIYLLDLARNEGPQALRVATYYLNPPNSITTNPTKDVFDIDTSKYAVGRSTCIRSLACTFFFGTSPSSRVWHCPPAIYFNINIGLVHHCCFLPLGLETTPPGSICKSLACCGICLCW